MREWFVKLFAAWPYWSFFASRTDQTAPLVLTLLLPGGTVAGEPGVVGWEFDRDELKPLLFEMFGHQNELIEREKTLVGKTPETRENAQIKNLCVGDILQELPRESFVVPEE